MKQETPLVCKLPIKEFRVSGRSVVYRLKEFPVSGRSVDYRLKEFPVSGRSVVYRRKGNSKLL
jgi:hypothetical protein